VTAGAGTTQGGSTDVAQPPRWGAPVAGMIATLAGIATAELAAALSPAVPSGLDALGQLVVAALPGPVVTTAIDVLGPANRLVLLVASLLVALLLGSVVGRLGARSLPAAAAAVAAVAAGAALASMGRPAASVPLVVVSLAAAASVTITLLGRLLGYLGLGAPRQAVTQPSPTDPPVDRRAFLRLGLATSVGATAIGALARGSRPVSGRLDAPTGPAPQATAPAPPVAAARDLATSIEGVSPVLTPIDRFFRIDTAIVLPRVDAGEWRLQVTGAVARPFGLSYDELLARDLVEVDATIACVSNEVGGSLIGTARWVGVPLAELLEEAGPTAAAEQVLSRSVDGFTAGFPLTAALDGRQALVAVGMNGEVLPRRHGYPARLVVPGLFGYVSATKWLSEIELTPWDGVDGYWIPRGWSKEGPVKTSARIDVPGMDTEVPAGAVVVAGVAWAPTRGIEMVEVLVGGEVAATAELVPPLSDATWVQWHADLMLPPGEHRLTVRATDGEGILQPEGPARPAPDGAEGWHTIRVRAV
jgi:DMSO/TMAO reductase YedYZ molybdopterin-dependent catalytic subunit